MVIAVALVAAAMHGETQAASIAAQPRILPEGTEVSGAVGKPGSVDVYSFMTLPGDTHSITARSSSKKPIQLQLLDPGGNAIMQASGVGEVSLEAIAAWGDAYSVAVIRAEPAIRYSIDRRTNAGTLQQFLIAHMAGYKRNEGLLTTFRSETNVSKSTVAGSNQARREGLQTLEQHIQKDSGKVSSSVRTMKIDGDVIAISEDEAGEVYKTTLDLKPERLRYDPTYKFTGYLCDS
jgi:hypothetical protein